MPGVLPLWSLPCFATLECKGRFSVKDFLVLRCSGFGICPSSAAFILASISFFSPYLILSDKFFSFTWGDGEGDVVALTVGFFVVSLGPDSARAMVERMIKANVETRNFFIVKRVGTSRETGS